MKRTISIFTLLIAGITMVVSAPAHGQRDIDYDWMMNTIDTLLGSFASGFSYPLAGVDNDGNGINEDDTMAMLSAILRGNAGTPPRLAALDAGTISNILSDFNGNRTAADNDLQVTGTNCTLLGAVGYPCKLTGILQMNGILPPGQGALLSNLLLDYFGGLCTVADTPNTFNFINNYIDAIIDAFKNSLDASLRSAVDGIKGDLHLQSGNYNRWGDNGNRPDRFGPSGQIDFNVAGNTTTNLQKYNLTKTAGRPNREAWLAACHIVPQMHITGQPVGGSFLTGDVYSMAVTFAGGTAPFTFQWQDTQHFMSKDYPTNLGLINITDGNGISGSNASALNFYYMLIADDKMKPWLRISDPVDVWNNGVPGNGAIETVEFGGRTSDFAQITVGARAFGIYQQPTGGYKHPGDPAWQTTFGVWGGTAVPTYQWYKDGTAISGQTTNTLTVSNITLASQGNYWCVATDTLPAPSPPSILTSNEAYLDVAPPMSVTTNPVGAHMAASQSFTFTVAVSGGHQPLTYQWKRASLGGQAGTGTNVGTNSATLALTSLTGGQQGTYSCVITDASYSVDPTAIVVSGTADLTVLAFASQPVPQEVQPGYPATFQVLVQAGSGDTGGAGSAYEYHYTWYQSTFADPNTWAAISSGFTVGQRAAYVIPGAMSGSPPAGNEGNYKCEIYDASNIVLDSSSATLSVVANPIVFLVQPIGGAKYVGDSQTFICVVSGGSGTGYSYHWRKDNGVTDVATTQVLSYPSLQLTDQGLYQCWVGDSQRNTPDQYAPSEAVFLEVANPLQFTSQPVDADLYIGDTYTPSIVTSGGLGSQRFQWYKDTTPLVDGTTVQGSVISGSLTPSLQITGVTLDTSGNHVDDVGNYRCDVSDDKGVSYSSNFSWLRVHPPLTITTQPAGATILRAEPYTFTFATSGGIGQLNYQWQLNGVNIPQAKNQNDNRYAVLAAADADAGTYTCVVTDAKTASVTTAPATLVVEVPFALRVQPMGADIYVGGSYNFTVTAEGYGSTINYQWYFKPDGSATRAAIPSATTSAYSILAAQLTDSGIYTVDVTDSTSTTITSNPAQLVVNSHLAFGTQPSSISVVQNGTAQLTAAVTGGLGTVNYQWQKSADNVTYTNLTSGPDSASLSIPGAQFTDAGWYRVIANDSLESVTSDGAKVTVLFGTPAAGPLALALLTAMISLAGSMVVKKKK